MKSFTLDLNKLVTAHNTHEGINKPVGYARDSFGTFYAVFIATDRETGAITRLGKENERIKLNFRRSLTQEARKPSEVLAPEPVLPEAPEAAAAAPEAAQEAVQQDAEVSVQMEMVDNFTL